MAIVFLFIGISAIAVGVRGQAGEAGKLLASEFTGPNSFVEWFAAIIILGVIGFYKPARPAANAMLGLVILAMFLRKGQGFFDQINQAITSATATPSASSQGSGSTSNPGANSNVQSSVQQNAIDIASSLEHGTQVSGLEPPVTPANDPFYDPFAATGAGFGNWLPALLNPNNAAVNW